MLVKATRKGYYDFCIRHEGDVFNVQPEDMAVIDPVSGLPKLDPKTNQPITIHVENPCSKWTEVIKDPVGVAITEPKAQTRFAKRSELVI